MLMLFASSDVFQMAGHAQRTTAIQFLVVLNQLLTWFFQWKVVPMIAQYNME